MSSRREQVEARAKELHAESCERRGVPVQWEGRGTHRTYYRRLARDQAPDQGSSSVSLPAHGSGEPATEGLTAAPPRPLTADMRGEINTALIELARPELDEEFVAVEAAQRRIERVVEGAAHPWPGDPAENSAVDQRGQNGLRR